MKVTCRYIYVVFYRVQCFRTVMYSLTVQFIHGGGSQYTIFFKFLYRGYNGFLSYLFQVSDSKQIIQKISSRTFNICTSDFFRNVGVGLRVTNIEQCRGGFHSINFRGRAVLQRGQYSHSRLVFQ